MAESRIEKYELRIEDRPVQQIVLHAGKSRILNGKEDTVLLNLQHLILNSQFTVETERF